MALGFLPEELIGDADRAVHREQAFDLVLAQVQDHDVPLSVVA